MAFATSCVSWCVYEWMSEWMCAYVGVYAVYAIIVVIVCLHFHIYVCFHRIVHSYDFYFYRHCCCCCRRRYRHRHRYVRSFTSFHKAFIIHRLNLQAFTYYYILIAFLHMGIFLFGLLFGYSLFECSFLCVFFFVISTPHLHSSFSPLHEYTITNLHVNKSMRYMCVLICRRRFIYLFFILGIIVV